MDRARSEVSDNSEMQEGENRRMINGSILSTFKVADYVSDWLMLIRKYESENMREDFYFYFYIHA